MYIVTHCMECATHVCKVHQPIAYILHSYIHKRWSTKSFIIYQVRLSINIYKYLIIYLWSKVLVVNYDIKFWKATVRVFHSVLWLTNWIGCLDTDQIQTTKPHNIIVFNCHGHNNFTGKKISLFNGETAINASWRTFEIIKGRKIMANWPWYWNIDTSLIHVT